MKWKPINVLESDEDLIANQMGIIGREYANQFHIGHIPHLI